MKYFVKTAVISALAVCALPAMALTATQTVQKEIISVAADGTETVSYASAELVTPGERIVYTLNYANDKEEAATDLVLTVPIPEEVVFAEGSAAGAGTVITFSVDGTNFARREALRVTLADKRTRPAGSEDISHVRWTIAGPVTPGETGALRYTGVLK